MLNMTNPFAPTILGEGGKGSGKELPDNLDREARRKLQLKNAQRIYREKNRESYNEAMRDLYDKKKKDKEWYNSKLSSAREANAIYRAKKKYERLTANDNKELDKIIMKDIKTMFENENKKKRGRPKKNAEKAELNEAYINKHYEAVKEKVLADLKKDNRIVEEPIENYVKVGTNDEGRPIYKKKEDLLANEPDYNYAEQIAPVEQLYPVEVLKKYYEDNLKPKKSKG